jgi:hypothetical protein
MGQRRSAWPDLADKGDPRRLPSTSEPRLGDRLVRGALAGSGPGTSPWIDGLSLINRVVPPALSLFHHAPEDAPRMFLVLLRPGPQSSRNVLAVPDAVSFGASVFEAASTLSGDQGQERGGAATAIPSYPS